MNHRINSNGDCECGQDGCTCQVCGCRVCGSQAVRTTLLSESDVTVNVCPGCYQKYRQEVFYWKDKSGREHRWSVELAKNVIRRDGLKPIIPIDRELAYDALCKNDQVHELPIAQVMAADLDAPLIIIEHPEGGQPAHIIIDGWHRIRKFVEHSDRVMPMTAYLLTEAQAKEIDITEMFA
ncbi:MAG: hypothetical protein KGL39_02730 [Patescibacteria group bacterium]|nr:hypothetical protein [Patescibacteria group bacterium]